jgi:hypothetical protein
MATQSFFMLGLRYSPIDLRKRHNSRVFYTVYNQKHLFANPVANIFTLPISLKPDFKRLPLYFAR